MPDQGRAGGSVTEDAVRRHVSDGVDALLVYVEEEKERHNAAPPTADYWRWHDVGVALRNARAQLENWR